jgi:hypothetical protein
MQREECRMLYILLSVGLALSAGIYCRYTYRGLDARIQCLERDLHHISDVVTQMADVQIKALQKHSTSLEGIEERIMELSVPSPDSNSILERRHQVLALARQGVSLEDIVKRLKAPVGEAEAILNLQKFRGGENAQAQTAHKQVRYHA